MNIEKILKSMSLKEKIGQLCLTGSHKEKVCKNISEGLYGSVLNHHGIEHINELQRLALSSNSKIPLLIGDDVIHGYRSIFPVPLALSTSFDLDLIEKLVRMSTEEASVDGINWIYSPMLDITHDPRWGRIMETAGEDPYYASLVGKSFIRGIQKPLKDGRISAACCKHYIGYGAVEAGCDYNTTEFSNYRLKQLYLPPFKKAIEEGAFSIMNDFTTYNDDAVTSSKYILDELLRKELNFNGVVVTDWECIKQLVNHRICKDEYSASIVALNLGIDIDMQSDCYLENLEKAIINNPLLEEKLNNSVKRVLEMKEKMGLFKNPYVLENSYETLSKENRKLCEIAATKSIILLKNDEMLPIHKKDKVLIIGPFVDEQDSHLGSWSAKGQKEDVVSIREAFKNSEYNITFINTLFDFSDIDIDNLDVSKYDKIIVTLGEKREQSGENHNRININLPYNQEEIVKKLKLKNKPLIGLIIAGRVLGLESSEKYLDAILFSYQLGIEAGNAYKNIISGTNNPQAKTTHTFPKYLGQVPIYYNNYSTGRPDLLSYVDGDTKPLYPFGYGLHYGKIDYSIKSINLNKIVLNVTNNSKYDIIETLEVFLHIPYYHKLLPNYQFVGFKQFEILKNTKKEITIDLDLTNFLLDDLEEMNLKIGVGTSFNDLIISEVKYQKNE